MASYFFTFFSFCLLLILGGCSNTTQVTGVCKSCKPYYVRGEWHYPQTHYDYDEIGLASWYGPRFHGKPKPHGEPYDQFEMTAAHKTLPIPTIALVTNLETGQSTKVLIDDRGPYVYEGRIIDLSVAAAKAIGVYKKGTAPVRVTALQEESDRFSKHLAQYRRAKCPRGRRWVKIFQDDIANNSNDLKSDIYHKESAPKVQPVAYAPPAPQPVSYTPPQQQAVKKEPLPSLNSTPQTIQKKDEIDHVLNEKSKKTNSQKDNIDKILKESPFKVHDKKKDLPKLKKQTSKNIKL